MRMRPPCAMSATIRSGAVANARPYGVPSAAHERTGPSTVPRTIRAHRAAWLGEAMDGWTAADRARFAEPFTRFVDGLDG